MKQVKAQHCWAHSPHGLPVWPALDCCYIVPATWREFRWCWA